MAKKKTRRRQQTRRPDFYESLPLAGTPPLFPKSEASFAVGADIIGREGARLAGVFGQFARAAIDDIYHFGRAIGGRLINRRARWIYLSLIIAASAVAVTVGAMAATSTLRLYTSDISSPAALAAVKKTGITITDRNGQILFQGYGASNARPIALKQLPPNLMNATLAAEDPSFYNHPGFSWKATARAIIVDTTQHGKKEGGSTITQQLVKTALLSSDKTYQRKFQEILLSMDLERKYSKNDILTMYLNNVYYGEGATGIEAASQTYFHTSVSNLTLAQSALLAGLPLGPSRLDPTINPGDAKDRRDYILEQMAKEGKISSEQASNAEAEPIAVFGSQNVIRAPQFVFYVLDQLRDKYGEDWIEKGGHTVTTTLDITKQDAGQAIVAAQINNLASHHVTNGGLISLDPTTGDIISMVGSYDYNAPGFGNVNVTLSQLQPGSSFKPFAYVTAFEKGWTGATIIDDTPISIPNGDGTNYVPQNYDLRFHGKVTVRHALDNSLNIPAVKALQFAGIAPTITTATSLGITTLGDPSNYGLSLVLGAGDVRPIDMAAAYGGFATGGLKVTPRAILAITDSKGKTILKATAPVQPRVLDAGYAYMITNILSDNSARQPEFPLNSPLKLTIDPNNQNAAEIPVAAKTGTTNDFRDNWTVGYTPNLVTAVWVGNNDHTPMQNVDGITGAAPIWHNYMEMALAGTPPQGFAMPAGVVIAKVCSYDGGLVSGGDQSGIVEVFPSSAVPTKPCGLSAVSATPSPSPTPAEPFPAATTEPTPTDTPITHGHKPGQ